VHRFIIGTRGLDADTLAILQQEQQQHNDLGTVFVSRQHFALEELLSVTPLLRVKHMASTTLSMACL
jgi:hypothetical protein